MTEITIAIHYSDDGKTRRIIGELTESYVTYFWVETREGESRSRLGTSFLEIAIQWFNEKL